MDNAAYAALMRQTGLRQEMQVIANNIANSTTDGFRREGVVFSEFVSRQEDPDTALSMARANGRIIDRSQGQLTQTGGTLDFAVEGEGYFMVQTAEGAFLTRAGHFQVNAVGEIVAPDGARLLDAAGIPIVVPGNPDSVHLARDGSLSVDGAPIGDIGVFQSREPGQMTRAAGVRFSAEAGADPLPDPSLVQGFVESSNVDPVLEVARMIEVQRAYEAGKSFFDNEHQRIRDVIRTLGQ